MVLALGIGIVLAYGGALWWLLRRETSQTLLVLLLVCSVASTVRLVYPLDYPTGLNSDEPKILACAMQALTLGRWAGEGCTGLPELLNVAFQAQLVPLLGAGRWSIRLYSLVTSVLAVAAAFAAARSLGFRRASSFVVAVLVAVSPWAVFYGRVSIGGELVFHELLLLAALARLVRGAGGLPEVAIGSLGQTLLLYDYFCGRAFLPISIGAAVLARGWRRLACLAIPAISVLAWLPYLWANPGNRFGPRGVVHAGFATDALPTLGTQLVATLRAFVTPGGENRFLTICAAAMHPWSVVGLAIIGLLLAVRRWRIAAFLLGGFALGIAPAVATEGGAPSTHRMMMAYPFVALAAGCAIDGIRWAAWRRAAALAAIALFGFQSLRLYFSSEFWPQSTRDVFGWEATAAMESIPSPVVGRLVVADSLREFATPRSLIDPQLEWLSVANWWPANGTPTTIVFGAHAVELLPFYAALVGPQRITPFGRAFVVRFEAADWSWMRQHGWMYEVACGEAAEETQVPTLFHVGHMVFPKVDCEGVRTHRWRGRWLGPPTDARLRFAGRAEVSTPAGHVVESARDYLDFAVHPGDEVTITVATPGHGLWAALFERTPAGERIPPWDRVSPTTVPAGVLNARPPTSAVASAMRRQGRRPGPAIGAAGPSA